MISHKMASPLGSIIFFLTYIGSFLNSLEEIQEVLDKKEKMLKRAVKYLALTQSQLQLMQSLCSDLLDLRRLKDGMFSLVNEAFNPSETFDLVCSIFSPQAQAKGINISWQLFDPEFKASDFVQRLKELSAGDDQQWTFGRVIDKKLVPKLYGDQRRLLQVLINLVKNAL